MTIAFQNISLYPQGILVELLTQAYAADPRIAAADMSEWIAFDRFFFENPRIADRCGFITTLADVPIGFVSWDPRKAPASVQIGHNCILPSYRGRGYGKAQMLHAVQCMRDWNPDVIDVTTGDTPFYAPARRMYEAVGLVRVRTYTKPDVPVTALVDYQLRCNGGALAED